MARFSSVTQLRQALGPDWADASDEEVLSSVATANNLDPTQLARRLGYGDLNAGKWGNRFSASGDNWQAGMYGVGEAAAGALGAQGAQDWFSRRRQDNELAANVARARAADQGAVSSYKDIGGVGDFLDYAGGLAVDSAPYFAEAAAGALVGGATLPATAARMGVRLGVPAARMAGMAGASYPSAVGDILQNQRETGQPVDFGAAAAGGVPYAALNLLGPESTLARGTLFRNAWRGLDNIPGVRGAAARTAGTMATQGVLEGVGETGQEGINQFFGRMAVDPNEQFFSPDAVDRYVESFVGGATLGGMVGGALGGWRRGQFELPPPQPQPQPPPVTEQPGGDLLGLPWNGYYTQQHGPPGEGVFIAGMGPEATTFTPLDRATGYDPTVQGELFPTTEVPRAAPYTPYTPREQDAIAVDTRTGDMFADRPDVTVQTDFSVQQVLRELAAVTEGRAPDSWTVKLATGISREIANPKLRDALAQERRKLERFFGHDPADQDGWTFDSQEQMDRVFTRLYQLDAAEAIVDRYYQRMVDAQGQAAAARGQRPGVTQQAPATTTGSEEDIRARNAWQAGEEATADVDARVAAGNQDRVDRRRQAILDEVLADPATTNARGRFTARLKKQGIADTALRPSEVARIDRWVESRAAFAESTQGELNFGDVAPGQTQDVVPPAAAAPQPQVDQKGQLRLFKRLPNAVQARSPETRTSQAVAPVVPEGQAAVPGEQAPAAKKGRARPVATYSEYNNIAVTLPAKPGVASVDRKVLSVGERLRELDGKANKYRQLIACLSQ